MIFGPDILNDRVLNFIDCNRDLPFFIYYSMILAHDPWVTTPSSLSADSKMSKFRGMMTHMDKLVGRVLDKIEQYGLSDNTLILFIGDNGTHPDITSMRNGRPVQGGKWRTTNAGTHVPFLLRWKANLPEGITRAGLVDVMDIIPTIASLIDIESPSDIDGINLQPHIEDHNNDTRDSIFMHYDPRWLGGVDKTYTQPSRFVFNNTWKLYGSGRFYNMEQDPPEEYPINTGKLTSEANKIYKQFRDRLDSINDGSFALPAVPPKIKLKNFSEPDSCATG